jgi:TP53 regulating kinase and related kinases
MAAQTHPYPLPKVLQYPASTPLEPITQGAEGRLYKTSFLLPDIPCALKYRPPKPYRHPILDQRLTRHRILAEAKILAKCRRDGALVPGVYALDEKAGWMMLEWIEGEPVRVRINEWLRSNDVANADVNPDLRDLMARVGTAVGNIHRIGVVHGDLTTSNLMLRPPAIGEDDDHRSEGQKILSGEVVVIDFGLASQSSSDEDRAVDLYVLERAFGSTHPRAEHLFQDVLDAYKTTFKQAGVVLKKLDEVRMRGRKKSMLG